MNKHFILNFTPTGMIPTKEMTPKEGLGKAGNWRSGLGLIYPHFHEDVSFLSLSSDSASRA